MANPPYIQQTPPRPSSMKTAFQSGRQVGQVHSLLNSILLEFPRAAVPSLHRQPPPAFIPPTSASSCLSSGFAEKTKVVKCHASIILATSKSLQASLPSLPSFYSVSEVKRAAPFPVHGDPSSWSGPYLVPFPLELHFF